jgi:uncharacterized protein (TIGR00255 family)
MRSMTGFGKATRDGPAGSVACEVRSFNHRTLKISLRLPPALAGWESDFEARVRDGLSRGAVFGTLRAGRPKAGTGPLVDGDLARRYAEALAQLGADLGVPGEPDLALLAGLPGVVIAAPAGEERAEELGRTAEEALDAALKDLAASRAREGAALHKDFTLRIRRIEASLRKVRRRAPRLAGAARERLGKRLRESLAGHPEASLRDAVAREVAVMAERGDVTEEVTRLQHHIESFRSGASAKGEVGRRLDFLLQEMMREVNTIGSKSQDSAVAAAVVDMKVEVDRMKEQAANVE